MPRWSATSGASCGATGLSVDRRPGSEIRAERLDHGRAVRVRVGVERDLHEARRVDGERLVVAAAARCTRSSRLAVEAAEDVHEAGAVLGEERRPVGEDGRADDRARRRATASGSGPSTRRRRRSRSAGRRPGRSGSRAGSRRSAAGRAASCPRSGRPDATTFAAPSLRETEIVPPVGESNAASSVPAWVTISDGTTMFWTPVASGVQRAGGGCGGEARGLRRGRRLGALLRMCHAARQTATGLEA